MFSAFLPMTIESSVLLMCVSFVLIEQLFYSAHQNQKRSVFVEAVLPRVADELDEFGGRERGKIFLDFILFFRWCTGERKPIQDQLRERLRCGAHICAGAFHKSKSLFVSGSGSFSRRRARPWVTGGRLSVLKRFRLKETRRTR